MTGKISALTYVTVVLGADGQGLRGRASPTPTDVAFALAGLAVVSTHRGGPPGAERKQVDADGAPDVYRFTTGR
ncbi:hypothetical protein [Micromonospora sp. B9E7]|uniref:hypothetical protein n=1 Tax=Micromonospora sp. B9E7 TaxID=3153574 RepID=UPI00325EF941